MCDLALLHDGSPPPMIGVESHFHLHHRCTLQDQLIVQFVKKCPSKRPANFDESDFGSPGEHGLSKNGYFIEKNKVKTKLAHDTTGIVGSC